MGRFEDELLKSLGVSAENVTDEQRAIANATRENYRRTGDRLAKVGCGMTIVALLVLILIALL